MSKEKVRKSFYICLGYFSITLGLIGVFLPLMPTTCFLIAAVWCFAWADKQYVRKLLNHPKLGPLVNKISPRFLPKTV